MTKFLKLVGGNVHQKYLVHANWSGIRNGLEKQRIKNDFII